MALIERLMQGLGLVPRIRPQSTEALPTTNEVLTFLEVNDVKTGIFIFKDFYERTAFSVIEMYREFIGLEMFPLPDAEQASV